MTRKLRAVVPDTRDVFLDLGSDEDGGAQNVAS